MLRFFFFCASGPLLLRAAAAAGDSPLPRALSSYAEAPGASLWDVLRQRVEAEPFNLLASLIFLLAICHTFLTARFRHWAHEAETAHAARNGQADAHGGEGLGGNDGAATSGR